MLRIHLYPYVKQNCCEKNDFKTNFINKKAKHNLFVWLCLKFYC